ncbi:hypothetical protein CRG98_039538 [Punica granatum]|uniref:Uncharacterized protein n=1 Tax=Punica granatum TaxID=22663 RepID=A0A2I0I7V6_PUNGR|nr:hypothetical protein CRG98_039538 [Punica granatum]
MLSLHPPRDLTSQLTGIDPCLESDPLRPIPRPTFPDLIGGLQISGLQISGLNSSSIRAPAHVRGHRLGRSPHPGPRSHLTGLPPSLFTSPAGDYLEDSNVIFAPRAGKSPTELSPAPVEEPARMQRRRAARDPTSREFNFHVE